MFFIVKKRLKEDSGHKKEKKRSLYLHASIFLGASRNGEILGNREERPRWGKSSR